MTDSMSMRLSLPLPISLTPSSMIPTQSRIVKEAVKTAWLVQHSLSAVPMSTDPWKRQKDESKNREIDVMKSHLKKCCWLGMVLVTLMLPRPAKLSALQQTPKKPNILFIMGDDIGLFNIGAYHRGMMSGKTPNLDKLATQGMLFTDYYAEASCTAGRAAF